MTVYSTDLLVIGAGIAGLYAALCCRQAGREVTVCSKSRPGTGSCSALSQGHFRGQVKRFTPAQHRRLTLDAGLGLNRTDLVDILVKNARKDILRLHDFGVPLAERIRGYESKPEKIGLEGLSISKPLAAEAAAQGVHFFSPFLAWRVIVLDGKALGVCGFSPGEFEPILILARGVILATGGAGALYHWTDNPQGLTGDGYAMAYQAGLSLMDMEFVQFFPLTLASSSRTNRLVPPIVAEIGTLLNARQEDLVQKYQITARPVAVAARDQLSLAMARETEAGLDVKQGAFELRIPDENRIWRQAAEDFGMGDVQRIKDWIFKVSQHTNTVLVRPAVHFCMGGVVIDSRCRMDVQSLFAAGEVVGGLHGANRYGGNALTETVVYAAIASRSALETLEDGSWSPKQKEQAALDWLQEALPAWSCSSFAEESGRHRIAEIRRGLQELMWDRVGLIRSEASLSQAEAALEQIQDALDTISVRPETLFPFLEARNRIVTSTMIVKAARMRRESRGAHYRADYPETDPAWNRHIRIQKGEQGMLLQAQNSSQENVFG